MEHRRQINPTTGTGTHPAETIAASADQRPEQQRTPRRLPWPFSFAHLLLPSIIIAICIGKFSLLSSIFLSLLFCGFFFPLSPLPFGAGFFPPRPPF